MEENRICFGFGRYGLDLIREVLSFDAETQTYTVAFSPDPRRYEWREVNGATYLYDRFFDCSLSEEDYYDMAKRALRSTIYYELADTDSARDYIKKSGRLIVVKTNRIYQ